MRRLRPYQQEAIDRALNLFKERGSAIIVLPTGMGKTVVMAKLTRQWERGNVLLLAHRIELLEQARDKLAPELGYAPVIEQAQRGMDAGCLFQGGVVVVASVQTLCNQKRLDKYRSHPFDLILVDECHHATSASYRKVIDYFQQLNPACKVLGVTATPRRADKTALGLVFSDVAYEIQILDAINDGWLVPIEQEYVNIGGVDFSRCRVGTNDVGESDMRADDLEQVMIEEEPLQAVAIPTLEKSEGRQGLIFTAGVAHAHLLAGVLNRERPDCAIAVDGETHPQKRKEAVEAFAAGKLQFLVNFGVFTEGFDVPPVSLIVMGRPTKSQGLYAQMLGRGTRPLNGVVDGPGLDTAASRRASIARSGKPSMLVLDFVGNSQHKLVSSLDILGGNYDAEVQELARQRVRAKGGDVQAALAKAKAEFLLRQEQERRKAVKAQVSYTTEKVDPFTGSTVTTQQVDQSARGGSTDSQIQLLVNLGVPRDLAAAYTKRQAGAVIDDIGSKRPTVKQRQILEKYGEPTDVSMDRASEIIDEIKARGWTRREVPA